MFLVSHAKTCGNNMELFNTFFSEFTEGSTNQGFNLATSSSYLQIGFLHITCADCFGNVLNMLQGM